MFIIASVMSSVTGWKTSCYKPKIIKIGRKKPIFLFVFLAGVTGIEPVNGEFRVHCLTAWLHPKINH